MSRVTGWVTHRWVKWGVLAFWVAVLAVLGPLAGKLSGVESNEAKSWLPAQAESTQVLDVAEKFSDPDTIPAVVLYVRDGGLTQADMAAIQQDVATYSQRTDLDGKVVGPVPSEDGEAAQVVVPVNRGPNGWEEMSGVVDDLRGTAQDGAAGMSVYVTGPAGNAADSSDAFAGIDSTLLLVAGGVVILILLLTYRSPVLWIFPLVSAGVALTVSQGVIYLLAEHAGLTVNAQSAGILTVLVFGAGTDYALLLVARYREELRRHQDRHQAMAIALHRAGPAIVASGATVVLGMLCLLLAQMSSTAGLGPVAAIGIASGLLVMLTLLPALLVVFGRWVFWPRVPHQGDAEPSVHGVWARIGARIARAPRRTWAVTSLVLVFLSLGMTQLDATGLSNAESFRGTQPSIVGEQELTKHFPGGAGTPVVVIADGGDAQTVDAVRTAFAGTDGIDGDSVTKPVVQGDVAYMEGTLTSAPDSQAAKDTVDRVRDAVHAVPGADAKVGGMTAVNLDVLRASWDDTVLIIPVVLLVVFLVLMVLLRALTAPLVLIGTVVLSFAAALGASALAFKYLFGFAGTDPSFPLFVFVFLVALGIDYNIFLMTRVREEAAHVGTRRGALIGLRATGGVITSAGLVLAGTFMALFTLPLVAFAEMGFAVALGVLLDTLIVRSVLVTALNLDIGRTMWWPSRLARQDDVSRAEVASLADHLPADDESADGAEQDRERAGVGA
ncbi:MMPL family transporter [Luteimicrobium subarcticum]|uniref:RND superfamily putative drug exporter n=1 Tax=Luteimicrobium subarcticum TaxID=620910 RepID=A0A2M8WJ09_9MICO|nr:MMPL family transporter [Luteimicrobium subarcticum]PJI90915.1 RND superfamily putative drug exporter [Luteimicrobium subarcticum]